MDEERYDIGLHLKNKHGYTDARLAPITHDYRLSWHLTIHEHDDDLSSFITEDHDHSVMDYAALMWPQEAIKAEKHARQV